MITLYRVRPPVVSSRFLFISVVGVCCALVACGKTQVSAPIAPETMMAAVRSYVRPPEAPEPPVKSGTASRTTQSPEPALQTESEYKQQIIALLALEDYNQLEQEARDARTSKRRLVGGVWRLYDFYDALTKPPTQSRHATEEDWNTYIETVKRWNSVHPESATARIVLAGTYEKFGSFARGQGYADTVSQRGWDLQAERLELAKAALLEAARLKDKCPYWFELMQIAALSEGWDKPLAKEILERATAFEPTYYHFYREYANYLQTKWYGKPGEIQNFAGQIADHVGGADGDIIYFEIASLAACQCQTEKAPLVGLSWPRIQEGYTSLNQKYGVSNIKVNRFALMAYSSDDKRAANQAFAAIGEDWDYTVWKNQDTFDAAKDWAANR